MATFQDNITELRKSLNKKRQEVADDLGISRSSLEYYEKGKRRPDIDVLVKLADYYGVSTDYLTGRTDAKTTDKDLRFVCDYTGLDEESVQSLKIKDQMMIPTSNEFAFDSLPFFMGLANKEYVEMYQESFNEVIQSTLFLDIVSCCCIEKIFDYCYKEIKPYIDNEEALDSASEDKLNKIKVLIGIFREYPKQHLLNLFCAQNAATDFVKKITSLHDYDSATIEKIIDSFTLLEHKINCLY